MVNSYEMVNGFVTISFYLNSLHAEAFLRFKHLMFLKRTCIKSTKTFGNDTRSIKF